MRTHHTYSRLTTVMLIFFASFTAVQAQKTTAPPPKATVDKAATVPPKPPGATVPPGNATVRDTAIIKLFDKPSTIKWARLFKGRMDDGAMIDISLGSDGKICRGYITYAKSRIRFRLEGLVDSTNFELEERDMARAQTGRLRGSIQGRRLEAEWTNLDNTIGSRIEAEEVP